MRIVILFSLGILFLLAICSLAGCAAGPNQFQDARTADGSVAGFWRGLWHGMILPVAFVISLFTDKISVYEVHSNGGWYNFGFLLGAATVWGGGTSAYYVPRSCVCAAEGDSESDDEIADYDDESDSEE